MHAAIHAAYQQIRKIYFPRWDRSRSWSLRICEKLPCFGCCNRSAKVIAIRPIPAGDGLRLLLIHEICHCCAGSGHGPRWQGRMLMAAATAGRAGMGGLANMIAEEVSVTGTRCAAVPAGEVYGAIRTCAADFPASDFDEIKGRVCRRFGLCIEEFEKAYRKARQAFEKAS